MHVELQAVAFCKQQHAEGGYVGGNRCLVEKVVCNRKFALTSVSGHPSCMTSAQDQRCGIGYPAFCCEYPKVLIFAMFLEARLAQDPLTVIHKTEFVRLDSFTKQHSLQPASIRTQLRFLTKRLCTLPCSHSHLGAIPLSKQIPSLKTISSTTSHTPLTCPADHTSIHNPA